MFHSSEINKLTNEEKGIMARLPALTDGREPVQQEHDVSLAFLHVDKEKLFVSMATSTVHL